MPKLSDPETPGAHEGGMLAQEQSSTEWKRPTVKATPEAAEDQVENVLAVKKGLGS